MKRRIVLIINSLVGITEAVVPFLALMGWLQMSIEEIGALMATVVTVAAIVKTAISQAFVTPVGDPRDDQGRRLAPVVAIGADTFAFDATQPSDRGNS